MLCRVVEHLGHLSNVSSATVHSIGFANKMTSCHLPKTNHHSQINKQMQIAKYNVTKSWNVCWSEITYHIKAAAAIMCWKHTLHNTETDELQTSYQTQVYKWLI